MIRPAGGSHLSTHAGHTTAQSTNWSGYAATGGTGAFTSVSASWTEPTATCSSRQAQYSSFWVGLDGYSSSSVEQTGTDADCSGRAPVYYGWYEMYPAFPVNFSNTVRPGDQMSAAVSLLAAASLPFWPDILLRRPPARKANNVAVVSCGLHAAILGAIGTGPGGVSRPR